ncbi:MULTISPECIES: 3-hydroxyacyl-CoA dehydrogenase NAD-binding domain-containing protein [Spongiibacter]|uniref:3-hydroxyacyl-CoA dehydrogenase NAD-binding domain-containing protein n=1 Tax=Spongiibacter TaxID=630749 RepID=UPI000C49983C|nr:MULTISPECIES: 3-hydroxyacyl-CoA dehydrogenase NAD-binding domain-containing protein [Spongiibacter]MBI57611.1 3-hydroxyacyl-CoA dehydrogenase [Spongiibacter sp.]MBO6754604.1 enoyl-CoA hydratase/isomerase family protein [Spongiibacter sp.]|tara:strand:+ start:10755 stop:12902 length:2148 start_codon:yes stop_codon:yes gene_type:complete
MTGTFNYEKDSDNIVTVTMDMSGPVNAMNDEYMALMGSTVERLEAERDSIAGVVLTSAKKTFFAGGDIKSMLTLEPGKGEAEMFKMNMEIKSVLRRLEKLGKPVVAAINGAALGGGYEICLCCHHRVALNSKAVQIGLPEVSLGLLPGGGGIVRMVNKFGAERAIMPLLEGTRFSADKAHAAGLVEELADSPEDMIAKAKAWVKANPEAQNPWDVKGFKIPGGDAKNPKIAQMLQGGNPMLYKKTRGLVPAPVKILDVIADTLRVDFDTALEIEARVFVSLVTTPIAKNLMNFFLQMNQVNGGGSRPKGFDKYQTKKVGVLGAGMMGQGIAYVSAMAGIEVVLKDISQDAADKGKAYSEGLLDKRVAKGRMTEEKKAQVLGLIKATADADDLQGCDLIIEAVFENVDLKHQITQELEGKLAENGVWGSNTSTLPITLLAEPSKKPENFIGIHFFSPVDKMPLVEIIVGEQTSDETLAKAFDYSQQIRKTPIVVNDSRGFFTSRVFATYLDEGALLLEEGVDPVLVENLGRAIGMPVGPLAVQDEVSQQLGVKATETNMALDARLGDNFSRETASYRLSKRLIDEHGRGGRFHGGGYYDYPAGGEKALWPEIYNWFYNPEVNLPVEDVKDRLLFRQVVESLRCYEEGVLNNVADANIGSIMGIGFPPHTGGVLQYVNTYGVKAFAQRLAELEDRYGERFAVPQVLKDKAEKGELFA